MRSQSFSRYLPRFTVATLALIGTGAAAYFLVRRWRSSVPEVRGAVSAVTGGPPEDMNGMPPTEDFLRDGGPVYDGHDTQLAL